MKNINSDSSIIVQIIYRNYKPLHQLYFSYTFAPPQNILYKIPSRKYVLKWLFNIFSKLRHILIFQMLASKFDSTLFFSRKKGHIDLYEFLHVLPKKNPDKPYIVDYEHVMAFFSFKKPTDKEKVRLKEFLVNENCKFIQTFSKAGENTLRDFMDTDWELIEKKSRVIYPSLPNFYERFKSQTDSRYVQDDSTLKILYVGPHEKGLIDLLKAVHDLKSRGIQTSTYIISDSPSRDHKPFLGDNVHFFKPRFTKEEIVKYFFIPVDVLVHPTRRDTFGMVLLDSLSSGTPVITTNQFAASEIIDKKCGWLIDDDHLVLNEVLFSDRTEFKKRYDSTTVSPVYVDKLSKILEDIYLNKHILVKKRVEALKKFNNNGKFSILRRNEELIDMYKRALS